ncbi:MAG TPA: Ig-like domain-containing protein [Acidobacteriaceae bacterium]|nr:Ig-like domain-containing protein [Acidobacteriaceae bacterium]
MKVRSLTLLSTAALFCLAAAPLGFAQTSVSPTGIAFPGTPVNTTSAPIQVTFYNQSGNGQTIDAVAPSGPFAVSGTNCPLAPATLGKGLNCTISVTFSPTVAGYASGSLTLIDTAANSPSIIPLTGTGTNGPTSVSPSSVGFGSVVVNQTSAVKSVALTNNGTSAVTLGLPQTTGDFAVTGATTCGSSLGPSATCTIYMTFTPTASGSRTGLLTIADSADSAPVSVHLQGTGAGQAMVSPASINFGNVADNQTSAVRTFTLTNNQSSTLTIASTTGFANGFALSPANTTCTTTNGTLGAHASCVIAVTFTPSNSGAASATLSLAVSAPNSPLAVILSGSGVPATSVSPASLAFGNAAVNNTSAIHTLTLRNNQSVTAAISSISVPPGAMFAIDPSTTCANPGTLAAGASCSVAVTFTPTATGAQSTSLAIDFGGGLSAQSIALSGAGVVPVTLTPAQQNFGQIVMNTTSPARVLTLTNNLSSTLAISSLLFGGPFALDIGSGSATTCATSGGTLAAGASCRIGVVFQPTAQGIASGQITIVDSAANSPQFTTLSGHGILATTLSTSAINFGNVLENTTSAVRRVTLANQQTVALHIVGISTSAPYAIDNATTTCSAGGTLGAGATCTIGVTLTPTALGPAPTGALTITHDAVTSPQSVALSGGGVPPVSVAPAALAFGAVVVGVPAAKTLQLRNNQATALTISSITGFTGGYSLDAGTTTCPMSPIVLAAGASCTIGVSVTATAAGSQPGSIAITHSAANSPQLVALTGTAIAPVLLTPAKLSFGSQFLGSTSAASTITVTNNQTVPLNIASVPITGADSSDFTVASACPAQLPAGASCSLSVTFAPAATGTRSAILNVKDDALGSPQTVSLGGAGNAPLIVNPTSITNFTAPVGSTSAYRTVTLKNSTSTPITISAFQFSGDFQQTSSSCGATGSAPPPYTLAAASSCNVTLAFAPTIGGTRNGQLQIYDTAVTSPQVVNLAGTGNKPLTLSNGSLSFGAQKVGTVSAPLNIKLTNHEVQPETFTLSPSLNFTAASNCGNGVIAAQSTCMISVAFAPGASLSQGTIAGSLTVADSAPNGASLVVALTGSAITSDPAAAVSVVSPGAGAAGASVPVVITGNGWTHFSSSSQIVFVDTNSSSILSGIAIVPGSQVAVSPNEIDATLQLAGSGVTYGARNIKVTTPLTGGGTETAQLRSAFIISDPSNAHSIVGVTPAFGTQGQTLNVSLTAAGTNFVQGTTFVNFGDGVTVNSLTINDATDAMANITISNTTPVGYRTITMVTGGEFATSVPGPSGNPIFQIGPNSAALLSISPNSEPQGFTGQVTLTALGTHFLQDATQVSISGGVIVGDVQVTSATSATAQVAVPSNAAVGVNNVTVATGGEIAALSASFTVTGATPGLISVSPNSAPQGQSANVVITGNAFTAFNSCPGGVLLADFTGEISTGSITIDSAHQVTVPIAVSPNANVGAIIARLTCGGSGNATIFPFTFSVTASGASIVSVTPGTVPQGGQTTLAVVGSNTSWVQGTTVAAFYPQGVLVPSFPVVTITSPTTATLNIAVPTSTPPGTYPFYMATGGQVVSASISVYAQTPTLTMSPANGAVPTNNAPAAFSVSFTGQFTHFSGTAAPVTLPVVAGQGVTLSNFAVTSPVSATATLTIAPGAATGQRLVTFTTGGEIVTTYFNVTSTPVGLVALNPNHAPQNDTLDVSIVGLNTHFQAGVTQVLFGPQITVNSTTVTDATHVTVNIATSYSVGGTSTPTPPGFQTVYVNTGAEQVIAGFGVDAPATPTLVSVSPNSGPQGSTENVTIAGSLTNWVQGQTQAILGAGVTVSDLTITSPTTATATIAISPTAPVGGNSVIMMTGSEIVSGTGFSVTSSAAYIAGVEPSFICSTTGTIGGLNCTIGNPPTGVPQVAQLQTATLNITGVGTHWLQGDTTASFGAGVGIDNLTVTGPTSATVQVTVLSSAHVGFVPLTMVTDGETVSIQQAIDIEEGSPALLAISPSATEQGATLNLQVLGRFTNWQSMLTSLEFNQDITVNSVNVIDSDTLTANITVSPWAYIDSGSPCGHLLTVTTASEQVNTGSIDDNFCVQPGAAQINSVSPLSAPQGSTEAITIIGSATHFLAGVTTVSFNDSNFHVGQVTVNSPASLTVSVAVTTSASTGFKQVTVQTYGEIATQQYSFTVQPGVATLNEAIPNQAQQGTQNLTVHLIGQYSHFNAASTATFGPGITVNSVSFTDATDLMANITVDPLAYTGVNTVTVDSPGVSCAYQPLVATNAVTYAGCTPGDPNGTGDEIVNARIFTIATGPAIITQVAPATGNQGQEVVFNITGSSTHWAQNITQFYIAGGGSDIAIHSVIVNSPTSATVDMSISNTAGLGTRSVYMITAGESLVDSGAFVITGGIPVITYLSPSSALQGTSGLEVTINGLYTQWNSTDTAAPSFGPGVTVTSSQIDDATHIEALVSVDPVAQPGYRTVVVQTGTGPTAQFLTSNFQVTAPAPPPTPSIWYFWPSQGLPGQTFDIRFTGSSTHWDDTTTAIFGDGITVNTFQVTGPTSAIANVTITAASALTVPISFNTASDSEVEDVTFNVVVAQPTLSIVDPGSGMQGAQNISVNILGQYTTFDNTTAFSFGPGVTVNSVTILGPTIATATISVDQLATLGGRAVTATTEGQTVGGAGFSVTPSLAQMIAVTPNTALQGQTITVAVAGQNTHWDGSTIFRFGSGIVVTNTVVNDATDATLTLAIPPLAPIGATGATATTQGEIASLNHAFVVQPGTPVLLSSGPGSVEQQSGAVFTILGQATSWTQTTPPVVSYGTGVDIGSVTVTSPTSLTVQGSVQPLTPTGYRNLVVSTGTQTLGIANALYVAPGPAVVNSVSPSTAGQASTLTITITGINTHWQQGSTQLTFPGVQINTFTVTSPTTATANITVSQYATPGLVNVTMTTLGEVAGKSNAFEITQTQPEMIYINPATAMLGQTETVTITALNTDFGGSGTSTTAAFGAGVTVNSVTPIGATQLQANVTVQPTTALGYRPVSVTTTGTPSGTQAIASSNLFQVMAGPAAIASLSPASGGQGQSVTVHVTGSQTNFTSGVTAASFGGGIQVTGISVVDLTHADVTVSIPAATPLGSWNVTLSTGGEIATILGGFTVTGGSAKLTNVNPPTGHQGATNLDVTLTGQFTNFVNGASIANFGADIAVNSTTVTSSTTAVANISISNTAALISHAVTVTTNSEVASITGGFTILAGVPALSSASPGAGQAGATLNVVVDGAFTNFQQGVTTVSFGSGITVNFVTVSSATQLTANITINSNASVGGRDLQITTNSQSETLSNGFSVTSGTPVITQINPNIGNPAQTLNVTLTGQYTNWVNGTTNAGFGPNVTVNSTTVNSATNLTANITVSSTAPLGPADVTTTTNSEVETVAGGFTIQAATIPAPSLLSLSPGANAAGMPINSSIVAVFSQPMNRATITSSTVLLTLVSNPNGYVSVPGTITVDATGRVLTFAPNALLAVNAQYQFQLTNGIKDATGNTFNTYTVSLYTTDAANTTAPTVVAANPPANTTVGTNVSIQLQFSADMNQSTQAGLTLMAGAGPVAGVYSWNSNVNCCSWGPGTILTFKPSAPLTPSTTYTVAYSSTLTDTAGNALTSGSFAFNTGSGPDTAQNYASSNFNGQANIGTNFAPTVTYSKPTDPLDINSGTLLLYNADSGKYIQAAVAVAPNGLSATLTPSVPLLPDTYYHLHQGSGYYDVDGNYLNGLDAYFTTGAGSDTTPPQVAFVSPAAAASSVPLNAQIVIRFNTPINPSNANVVQVIPNGGSPIPGTPSLASDLVTLIFTPTLALQSNTEYTVQVSGYGDLVGNSGPTFTSTFTTNSTALDIDISTGIDASGNLITTGDTVDPHWTYYPTAGTSGETNFQYPGTQPLKVVSPSNTDWYSNWVSNGPNSSWVAINPDSTTGNSHGFYSTSFTLPNPLPSGRICLAGAMSHDDNGLLAMNGTAIMSDQPYTGAALVPLNIDITGFVTPGTNYLTFAFGSTDNSIEGLRLQATVETCGASVSSALSLTGANPANNATGVSTASNITLTFSNPVDPLTVNTSTLPVMIGWNSGQEIAGNYQVNGNIVTFTPDSPLPADTNIWVGACNGPLDLVGDSAGSCYTQLTSFTTGNTATAVGSAFQVIAFAPGSNAVNVGLRAPVVATFNRSFNPNTINRSGASDFALFSGDSQQPWCAGGSYMKSQDNSTLQFNCYPLPAGTPMTAMLNGNLQDWQGNPLANFSSQFSTAPYDSNTNGSLITSRPGNGASGVDPSQPLILYFNLPINSGTANSGIQVAQNNIATTGSVQVLDGGYTLEFTPSSSFVNGALIQWQTTSALADSSYNTPINGASGYFYTAAGTSALTPAVQVVSPPAYSNPVPQNTIFDVQFNTPINAATVNSGNIYVRDSSSGLNIPVTYSEPQPNQVRMVPQSDLPANHYIYVYVTTGLQSSTSVPAAANSWYIFTGSPDDASLPVVTNAVPYNGAGNVGVNISPGVVLSKPVDPVSLNANTFQLMQGSTPLAGTYWMNSTDTRIEFVPNAPLPASATLTMALNGVMDREGHSVTYSTTFQTGSGPDFTSPSVVWTSVPSNGSVPINSTVTVQFSESMDITTFSSASNLRIYDTLLSVNVSAALTWSSDQSAAYLSPSSPLAAGRQYILYVSGGTDLAGNAVNGIGQTFYAELTAASSAPTVILFNPLSGATGIGANAVVEAEFSGTIDPNSISGVTLSTGGTPVVTTPVLSAGNTVLQLMPHVPLAPNTAYTMTVAGAKDPAGNVVPTTSSSFTTGPTYDINSPSVVSYDPPNDATVGTNVIPKLVFNKPLNPITVTNNTFRMYVNQSGQWVPLTVTPSADGLTVSLQPQIPLLPDTLYHYQACCNFQDQDGNNGNQSDLYFYTGTGADTTNPTVAISPVNASSGVPLNTRVIAASSTPIDVTSWNRNSVQLFDNSNNPIPGVVTLLDSQTLSFAPTGSSPAGTSLGCYADNGNRALNGYTFSSNSMTVEACVAACGSQGYTYAGAQSGNQCFCGNGAYSTLGASTACTSQCSGNTSEICGGSYSNSVYTAQANAAPVNLAPNATYTARVSGFTDTSGNTVAAASSIFTTSSSASNNGLSLSGTNIPSGATGVSDTQPVVLTFTQTLDPATVNSGTLKVMNSWNSSLGLAGTYSVSGDQVTFIPASPYPAGATIYVGECGGPTDVLGEVFLAGACYNQQLLYFTVSSSTTDTSALQVTAVQPGDGATNVGLNQPVSVTFNKSVSPGSAGGYNSLLFAGQGIQDDGNISWSADNRSMTFNSGALYNATNYTIALPAGGITDMSGNSLQSDFLSTFSTLVDPSSSGGSVIGDAPGNNASGVPINSLLTLYLNRQVNAATLPGNVNVTVNGQPAAGAVTSAANGYEVQFTPTDPFPNSAVVQWFFSNVQDVGGDTFNSASNSFTTVASVDPSTAQPTILAVSPAYGSSKVPTNTEIDILYSQPIDPATLTTSNLYFSNSTPIDIAAVTPYLVRITPAAPLSANTTYYFCATSNIKGANGVASNGGCWTTYFTTTAGVDTTPGAVTLGPPNGVVNVGTNAYVRVQFSKPADRATVNSANIRVMNGGNAIPGTWSYNYNGSDLVGANFYPLNSLPPSATITVSAANVLDYAGNTFTAATSQFTTAAMPDYTNPSVSYDFPYNTTGIGTNAIFACRYTEPMDPSSIATGSTYVWSYGSNAAVPVTYSYSSDMMSVTMMPTSPLTPNSEFNYACNSAIDLTGNAQSNGGADLFYTGSGSDTTGPSLLQANPPNGFTGVAVNTNNGPFGLGTSLGLLFSEPVASNSLAGITLTPQGGTPLGISIVPEIGNRAVLVQLPSTLQPNTTYTWSISGVTDFNGNPMTPVTSSFTTGAAFDWTSPTFLSTVPASNSTGIPDSISSLTVTFSEAMNPVLIDSGHIYLRVHNTGITVATTFTISPDSKTVTLTPTAPLAAATIYDIVTASPNWYMTDIAGNPYYSTGVVATFTTQ